MVWLDCLLRVSVAAVAGALGVWLGTRLPHTAPPLAQNALFLACLGAFLATGLSVGEAAGGQAWAAVRRIPSAIGLTLAVALGALVVASLLLAVGGDERATLAGGVAAFTERGAGAATAQMALIAGMSAMLVAVASIAGAAAMAATGTWRMNGKAAVYLWGGALGGGFGAMLYELWLFWLAPHWRHGAGGLAPPADAPMLAGAWLGALVGLALVVAERVGHVVMLRGEDESEGLALAIHSGETTLGSSPACDAVLSHPNVEPVHARMSWSGGALTIEAATPEALIGVNGELQSSCELAEGDEVTIGGVTLRVSHNLLRVRGDAIKHRERPEDDAAPPPDEGALRRPGAEEAPTPAGPRLVVVDGVATGEAFAVPEGLSVIGGDADANVRLLDPEVATRHATLLRAGSQVRITDEVGTSGLFIDGVRTATALLAPGTQIRVGATTLMLILD